MTFGLYVRFDGEVQIRPGPIPEEVLRHFGAVWACTVISREGIEVAQDAADVVAHQQMWNFAHRN